MTDLDKAKQYREQRFGASPWMDTTDVDKLLIAYVSHSNSELLERVQKLEQQIDEKLEFAKSMHAQCSNVNSYLAGWADGAIETLNELKDWAKAPETRDV